MDFIRILYKYKLSLLYCGIATFYLRFRFPKVNIATFSQISFENKKQIYIGNGTRIGNFSTLIIANDPNNNLNISSLNIGSNTYIGEYNNIRAGGGTITIGNNCLISQHITIVASNHSFNKGELINRQPWKTNDNYVTIEDDVWIGANSVILPGITIGEGAVIGCGSIVTKSVPKNAIVYGNPAKIIKYREYQN
jgi:acetyltransferase-like isoleucine patch superfamily enzyme